MLAGLACAAWQGFLRAYQTHSKDTRSIFQVKKLHLGHLAKGFGLKDKPSKVAERARQKMSGGKNEMGQRERVSKESKLFKKSLQEARRRVRASGGGTVVEGVSQGVHGEGEVARRKKRRKGISLISVDTFEFGQ
jgi:hypothetical protein